MNFAKFLRAPFFRTTLVAASMLIRLAHIWSSFSWLYGNPMDAYWIFYNQARKSHTLSKLYILLWSLETRMHCTNNFQEYFCTNTLLHTLQMQTSKAKKCYLIFLASLDLIVQSNPIWFVLGILETGFMGIVTQNKKMKSSIKDFFNKRDQVRY